MSSHLMASISRKFSRNTSPHLLRTLSLLAGGLSLLSSSRDRESLRAHFDLLGANPRLVRILIWASAERPETRPREGAAAPRLLAATIERLREGQRDGDVRDDIDAVAFFIAFAALSEYWFLRRDSLRAAFGDWIPSDEVYLDTIVKLLTQGVSAAAKPAHGSEASA